MILMGDFGQLPPVRKRDDERQVSRIKMEGAGPNGEPVFRWVLGGTDRLESQEDPLLFESAAWRVRGRQTMFTCLNYLLIGMLPASRRTVPVA